MNGNSNNTSFRMGPWLANSFCIESDAMSLSLLTKIDRKCISTVFDGNDSFLTSYISDENGLRITRFSVTDRYFSDKGILERTINSKKNIEFSVKCNRPVYHSRYTLNRRHFQVIQDVHEDKIIYLIMSGDIDYDTEKNIIKLYHGMHQLILAYDKEPASMLKAAYTLLSQPAEHSTARKLNAAEYTALQGNIDSMLPDYLYQYSLKAAGLRRNPIFPSYNSSDIIRGMLPFSDNEEGSAIETLMYIHSNAENADRVKALFRENFVRGNGVVLNSRKRLGNCRMPRFKKGLCPYCKNYNGWLEKTRHISYACPYCYHKANDPQNIPDTTEHISPIPLLIMIYLGLDIPLGFDIPSALKDICDKCHSSLTLGLLLYALCSYSLPEKEKVYRELISYQNLLGIWNGVIGCCPVTNAVCCAAIKKYKKISLPKS